MFSRNSLLLDDIRDSLKSFSRRHFFSSRDDSHGHAETQDPLTSLCSVCFDVDLHQILNDGLVKEKAIQLGPLLEILEKAEHCVLCRLIKRAFQDSWFLDTLAADVDLSEVTCGLYAQQRGCLRDPLLPEREHCFGLVIYPSNRPKRITELMTASRSRLTVDIQLMEQDARRFGRLKEVHGRKVGEAVDFALVKKWIEMCQRGHCDVCENVWWKERGEQLPKTVRMVDIKRMRIVPVPDACRYLALSYVWGGVGTEYQTMKENIGRRMKYGGLDLSILPATIVDAIEVCRRLGERYIWVDALCIVQDSPEDKVVQIGVMEMIYGGSFVTIFAIGGYNAHAGLPGLRTHPREHRQPVEAVQGLHFSPPFPNLTSVLYRSVWGSRGWTFQELMLSRRRLFFTDYQVYFECMEEVWCEDVNAEAPRAAGSYHPMRFTGTGGFTYRHAPSLKEVGTDGITDSFCSVVDEYSPRKLTSDFDAIDAVSALITAITKAFRLDSNAFRYGMLLIDLDRTLLWTPTNTVRLKRRCIPEGAPWPSWSWVGWQGAVQYVDKWSLGQSYPRVAESLIDYYLYEGGTLRRLVSNKISITSLDQVERYSSPEGYVELAKSTLLPEGTLVFRTTSSHFRVGEPDLDRTYSLHENTQYGLFAIHPVEGIHSAAAGRIFLPTSQTSNSEAEEKLVELIILARSDGERGICDETEYSTSYQSPFLTVMAVKPTQREGYGEVVERIGVGIVSEQAWLSSNAQTKVVFLC